MSTAAHSAASGVSTTASNTPGLLLGQLGCNIMYSHTTSDIQTITCMLSHLIAGSSAKIQQSEVKQPHFLSTSGDKSGRMDVLYTEPTQPKEVRARKGF